MRVLLLAEGDAETRDSWSGISRSVLLELRSRGHTVIAGDVELHGLDRWVTAALTFSPDRLRWRTRFRLGAPAFEGRSRRAARRIATHTQNVDVILQVGATFEPRRHSATPYVLFCDSNVRLAMDGAASGYGEAVALSTAELSGVEAREVAVYQGAAAIFTLSEYTRQSFVRDFSIAPERVTAVHGGPNFDVTTVPPAAPADSAGPPTVLFVGRQFARKGGDLLLEAFRKVRRAVPNAELVIVGPQRLDVSDPGVRFLGFLDKDRPDGSAAIAEAYRSADVFCLPTRFEAFGIAFIEAMHFGLPCIGTRVWAVPEIIADGETGFVVPRDDVDTLTERLVKLLGDRALARRMGAAGRARALRLFTWSAVVDRMLEKLEGVIAPALGVPGNDEQSS